MDRTKNIAQVRDEIAEKKKARHHAAEQIPLLSAQCREIANWLAGHEARYVAGWSRLESGEEKRVSQAIEERKAELASLREKIGGIEREIKSIDADLGELVAIRFGADDEMVQAMSDYRDAQGRDASLKEKEQALRSEKERADIALAQAKTKLASAKTGKSKALSIDDIAKATRGFEEARQRVADVETLQGNLADALRSLEAKKAEARADIERCEKAVWDARWKLILSDLANSPEFTETAAALGDAYASWVAAGNAWDFEHFLRLALPDSAKLERGSDCFEAHIKGARRIMQLDSVSRQGQPFTEATA